MKDSVRNDPALGREQGAGLAPEGLAAELSRIALSLEHEEDLQGTLDAIVSAAIGTVPGAQDASISMVKDHREVSTRASTSDLPRRTDQAQYDAGEAPAWMCSTSGERCTCRTWPRSSGGRVSAARPAGWVRAAC